LITKLSLTDLKEAVLKNIFTVFDETIQSCIPNWNLLEKKKKLISVKDMI
jgi:hypothetical protein